MAIDSRLVESLSLSPSRSLSLSVVHGNVGAWDGEGVGVCLLSKLDLTMLMANRMVRFQMLQWRLS